MKSEKSIMVASVLNFIVWGSGYFYLNKQIVRGLVTFILYDLIWLFSLMLIFSGSVLTLPVLYWVIFWSLWCSIFLVYDISKIPYESKIRLEVEPIKIKKVKSVVRRSKVRTKKK